MKEKKKGISENRVCRWWNIATIGIIVLVLTFVGAYTGYIDPCFHYHAPLTNLFYPLYSQRYQNNGIAKHFDYDAMIVGTSMTENFKTSEVDALFGCHAVKTSFSGAYMRELADQMQTAYDTGHNVKMIISTLDGYMLEVKDAESYNPIYTYPTYLYDKNVFNDVAYLLNKNIFLNMAIDGVYDRADGTPQTTSFDDYSFWSTPDMGGKDVLLSEYEWQNYTYAKAWNEESLPENWYKQAENVLQSNLIPLIEQHPETEFYLFIPPYSIYDWDSTRESGSIAMRIAKQQAIIEALLPYENVRLFSFYDAYDIVTNANNYRDTAHYKANVNSVILQWMAEGNHQLTQKNYEDYLANITHFYASYDYKKLHG